MPEMERVRDLKPWLTNKLDIESEMKLLGLKKKDLRLDEKNQPIVLDVANNHIDRVLQESS